jgi:GT2 family glycosyltransferase
MFRFKLINLLQESLSEISHFSARNRFETQSTMRIRFYARRAGVYGWYRFKLKAPNATMNRLLVLRDAPRSTTEIACDANIRAKHVGGYLFIQKGIEFLELEIDFSNSETNLSATLRPISFLERVWLAIRSPARTSPRKLLRLIWPNVPIYFDFKFGAVRIQSEGSYKHWIRHREKRAMAVVRQRLAVTRSEPPPISILLPVCDPPPKYLREAIRSVGRQTRGDWQLCIADDASKNPEVIQIIRDAVQDQRVNSIFRDQRGNISAATNSAFTLAQHPFVFCLDHDDVLAARAIEFLSQFIGACPDTEFIYSDEDIIDADGMRLSPVFKPDFSPDLLRSCNYLNHISMYRTESVRVVGGWRTPFDGAQDYDLALRIFERVPPRKIRHLPLVLYHWRAIPGSTALDLNSKPWASEAGRAALQEHLRRSGCEAEARILEGTLYRIVYALPKPTPRASIIIPVRDRCSLLRTCIRSILDKTIYENYDILIVDNGSVEDDTLALLNDLRKDPRIRIIKVPGPFNYSALNNKAVAATDADFVCFLNSDTRVISPGWLSELISRACQQGTGCVGPRLLYDDGTIQHAGIILGLGGVAGHAFTRQPHQAAGAYGRLRIACNYSALTGACLVVRRALFLEVGGFDEKDLPIVYSDFDFCLKVRAFGFYNVYTPFAELFHSESLTRGPDDTAEKQARFRQQEKAFALRYEKQLWKDPFYSPHHSLTHAFAVELDGPLDKRIDI